MISKYLKKSIILIFILLPACSAWENFVTYFNTFYNAQKYYEEALQIIKESKPDKFKFKQKRIPSSANKPLKQVIKNLSDILQHHPKSKYVDESLLLLGKVFFYQQKFPKAERKFKELATKKNSEFYLENLLWLGKTELHLRKFNEGLKTLHIVEKKAEELNKPELRDEAYVSEIAFHIYREKKDKAIEKLKELFGKTEDEELKAELAYTIGKLYKKEKDFKNASIWFSRVLEYDPDFETEFRSKLEYATMQRQLGNYDKSLKLLEDLRSQDKFNDFSDEIEVALGKVYFEMGNLSDAFYEFSLVDSVYAKNPTGGEAKFMLGNIMFNIYRNYDSAYVYYDAVRKSKAVDKIKLYAKKKVKTLDKYFKETIKQKKFEKQYLYATKPEIFVRDSLAYEEFLLLNSSEENKIDSFQNADTTDIFTDREKSGRQKKKEDELLKNLTVEERIALQKKKEREEAKKKKKPERPKISADSLKNVLAEIYLTKGNLFLSDIEFPDSAKIYYEKILNNFDSTRFDVNAFYNLASYYNIIGDSLKSDSLFLLVYNNFPESPLAESAAIKLGLAKHETKNDPAEKEYLKAEAYLEKHDYDSAKNQFLKIYLQHKNSPFAAKSIYTIGWIYENILNIPDSAYAYYKKATEEFKTTEYARAVNRKVKIYEEELKKIEEAKKSKEDSLALKNKNITYSKTDSLKGETVNPDSIQTKVDSSNIDAHGKK